MHTYERCQEFNLLLLILVWLLLHEKRFPLYEIGSSSIRIRSESVAAFVPASGAAAGED